jgi:hypothetical protein
MAFAAATAKASDSAIRSGGSMLRKNHAWFEVISRLEAGNNPVRGRRGAFWYAAFALTLLLLAPSLARADEPLFGFCYTTDLLPKGKSEIEQWSTTRFTKAQGNYWEQENRTELEHGISDRLQLALYANYDSTAAYHNGPFGATTPGEQFSNDLPDANAHYSNTRYIGVSGEAIFRVRSPYEHFLGLAFYEEPTVGPDFFESESKVILQKNYRDDRMVLCANATYAPELRKLPDPATFVKSNQEETDANINLGASYRFMSNWSAGLEFLNEREFNSYVFHQATNSGYFVGPVAHFGGRHLFATAGFYRQMPWAGVHSATIPGAVVHGYDFDNDFEKYRVRVKFGWYF